MEIEILEKESKKPEVGSLYCFKNVHDNFTEIIVMVTCLSLQSIDYTVLKGNDFYSSGYTGNLSKEFFKDYGIELEVAVPMKARVK